MSARSKRTELDPWKQAWLITINTNQADVKLIKPLRTVWQHIITNMVRFLKAKPGGKLLDTRENSAVEVGPKYHKIHMHSKLEVSSLGIANLNYPKIKEFINTQLARVNVKGVHFNARLVKNYNQTQLIEEYLNKQKVPEDDDDEDEFEIQE